MPIPVTTSTDALLTALLVKHAQAGDFEGDFDVVKDVLPMLPNIDRHITDETRVLPASLLKDIRFLERHCLVEFDPSNPHIKLTALGIYSALLFEIPPTLK